MHQYQVTIEILGDLDHVTKIDYEPNDHSRPRPNPLLKTQLVASNLKRVPQGRDTGPVKRERLVASRFGVSRRGGIRYPPGAMSSPTAR